MAHHTTRYRMKQIIKWISMFMFTIMRYPIYTYCSSAQTQHKLKADAVKKGLRHTEVYTLAKLGTTRCKPCTHKNSPES